MLNQYTAERMGYTFSCQIVKETFNLYKAIIRLLWVIKKDILVFQRYSEKNSSIEAVTRRCSVKKVFLEISQNSQDNTYVRASFLIKLQAWGL